MLKSRKIRWVGHVEDLGETKNAYILFSGELRGKIPPERPVRISKLTIKIR
jgi:hypothetical protein